MPISYEGNRIYSADATALMRRINALESVVYGGRWTDPIAYEVINSSLGGLKITCDLDGHLYVLTGDLDSGYISKTGYGLNDTIVDFIAYDATRSAGIGTASKIDANESGLWVLNGAYLSRYNLSGTRVADVVSNDSSIAVNIAGIGGRPLFRDMCVLSDGSIFATHEYKKSGASDLTLQVVYFDSAGSNGSIVVGFGTTALVAGAQLTHIEATSSDGFIVTKKDAGVYTSYRYNLGGGLLDTITDSTGDGFSFPVHIDKSGDDDLIHAFSLLGDIKHKLTEIDGSVIDIGFGTFGAGVFKDVTTDENGKVYIVSTQIITPVVLFPDGIYPQTEFMRYPDKGALTNPETIGTPDAGVTIPALTALQTLTNGDIHRPHYAELEDMRLGIEEVCPYYINAVTGNPFNITDSDPDNIFFVALPHEFGISYTWTTPTAESGERMRETDMTDIDLVLELLEASDLA